MKRALAIFVVLLIIAIISCYVFIPGHIRLQENMFVPSNPSGFQRALLNENKWRQWWPGKTITDKGIDCFTYNGFTYTLTEKTLSTLVFHVRNGDFSDTVLLHCVTSGPRSVLLNWEADIATGSLPLARAQRYAKTRQLSNDLKILLEKAKSFYSQADNIYDIPIKRALVVDSTLLFTSARTHHFPGTAFIYTLIDRLAAYATSHSANITGYPMLNISTRDSIEFLTKVALPVDKKLPSSGTISYRWMLGGGNILVTEVKGGFSAISKTTRKLEEYISDHGYVSPAIPYQSLVTNRLIEKDTSKWITRIYYPIM